MSEPRPTSGSRWRRRGAESHGGLGGDQNNPVLLRPADRPVAEDLLGPGQEGERVLTGAPAVHRQLVRWLEQAGVRPRRAGAVGVPGNVLAGEDGGRVGRGPGRRCD